MPALTLLTLVLALGQTPQIQAAAINAAKNSIARDMNKTLPQVTFEAWLQGLAGTQAVLNWSVTDCGEQTGNPLWIGGATSRCARQSR